MPAISTRRVLRSITKSTKKRIRPLVISTSLDSGSTGIQGLLVYEPRPGHQLDDDALSDPLEFLARVLIHVPKPNKHLVHFYGAYANRVRRNFRDHMPSGDEAKPDPPRRAANKRWAELIYRIYEVDPLTCNRCGGGMKFLASITDPAVIRTILDHRNRIAAEPRAPPDASPN